MELGLPTYQLVWRSVGDVYHLSVAVATPGGPVPVLEFHLSREEAGQLGGDIDRFLIGANGHLIVPVPKGGH